MVEGAPVGTAVYNRIVKNTYENRTRTNPVCKKAVRGGVSEITRTPSGEEGEYFHIE